MYLKFLLSHAVFWKSYFLKSWKKLWYCISIISANCMDCWIRLTQALLQLDWKTKKKRSSESQVEMNHILLSYSRREIGGPLKFNCRSKSKLQTQSLPSCHYLIVVYTGPENKWGVISACRKKWPLLFNQKTAAGNTFYSNHYLHLPSILCRYRVVFIHTLRATLTWYITELVQQLQQGRKYLALSIITACA